MERNDLPAFPESGVCECGSDQWCEVETGYSRMSSASVEDDGVMRVLLDGWDDMGDGGDEQHFECAACYKAHAYPNREVVHV